MYERILLATDGSEAAERATAEAIDLAVATGAELVVLSVADTTVYSTVTIEGQVDDVLERESETIAGAVVERANDRGVAAESVVRQGRPWEEIRDAARDLDVDLVVMGTSGESGLSRALLGSTTDRVLREASLPVHVVPPAE
ncbi:MAG: universal stress protein [Halanaeroarchaeum sp.]